VKKCPVVLVDDPRANDQFDLNRVLSGWRYGLLAVVEPRATQAAASGAGEPAEAAGVSQSAEPAGEVERYSISGRGMTAREFAAPEAGAVLKGLRASPLLVVSFVSHSTFPLLNALAQDEYTRDFLKVGVTGVRMDSSFNLAQKLLADGKIAYHEHSLALERVLLNRLGLMQQAHEDRLRSS
jgi:hypothetical protein